MIRSERTKIFLKLILGSALIFWVLRSRMVDFQSLESLLLHPANLAFAIFFLALCILMGSARWFLLARAQGLSLSLGSTVELTMVGQFFNTFMPGAVGGDIIKAWYVAGREPKRKARAVFTVLLDRALGLSVFCLYAGVSLLFYLDWLKEHPRVLGTAYAVWGLTGGGIAVAALLFLPRRFRIGPLRLLADLLKRLPAVSRILSAVTLYRNQPGTIAAALTFSCLSITSNIVLFSLLGSRLDVGLEFSQYFFVVPIALTVSAIPLLPGGIGVGQVAFFTLLSWMGHPNPELGGTLCTLFQIYSILFNSLGAIFYLRFKRKPGTLQQADGAVLSGSVVRE